MTEFLLFIGIVLMGLFCLICLANDIPEDKND